MNAGTSTRVFSNQRETHPALTEVLQRHFESEWRQPLHEPSVEAFNRLLKLVDFTRYRERLILDSGCGTGAGTLAIAAREPGSLVLGIDRSSHRLAKTGHGSFPCRDGNVIWIRSELETFWRLAAMAGWKLYRHFILYPNPWPKKAQLRRRWHAHPVFPVLLGLGGILEMRTNWQVYAREFARALEFATGSRPGVDPLTCKEPLTPFERKYSASGHALYQVVADLGGLNLDVPSFPVQTGSG